MNAKRAVLCLSVGAALGLGGAILSPSLPSPSAYAAPASAGATIAIAGFATSLIPTLGSAYAC